jgi:zinc/manganese transport system substrate-binding protein
MKRLSAVVAFVLCCASGATAHAKLSVFACEPEWAALAAELGGSRVSVYQATSPKQDPHRVEARPSLVARARSADMIVCTGADLEIGWLPVLMQTAGNRRIQPGQPGYFLAAEFVERLDTPAQVDRSMGDVHPQGNPHVHLNPHNIARIGRALSERLAQIDSGNAAFYAERGADFQARWAKAIARWESAGAALRGLRVVTYHRDSAYLAAWLGLNETLTIEPKPGIPPSAGHLAELLSKLKADPAQAILRMVYNDPKAPEWLSERTGVPVVELPFTVGGTPGAGDLFGLFDDTLARLGKAAGR